MKLINTYLFLKIIATIVIDYSFAEIINELNNKFVQHKVIELRSYEYPVAQNQQFEYEKFENIPNIIVGIIFYNNQKFPNPDGIDFHVSHEQVNLNNCGLTLHLEDPTYLLYGIKVMAMAIDCKYIPNIKVSALKQYNTTSFIIKDNIYMHVITEQYSTEIKNFKGKKNVAVFLNGFKTKKYNNERLMKIAIEVEPRELDFLIKVISKEESIQIETVYIQYIEYTEPENEDSNFFAEIFVENTLREDPRCLNNPMCFDTEQESLKQERVVKQFKTIVKSNNKDQIFFGINQLDFKFGSHQKIELRVTNFQDQNIIIDYFIEKSEATIIYGIQSTFIIIGIRKCMLNNDNKKQLYFQKNCYENCSNKGKELNYYNVDYCGCEYSDYFNEISCEKIINQNQSQCQMLYFPYNTCKKCNVKNCIKCNEQQQCTQCSEGYDLKQSKCEMNCLIENCIVCKGELCSECKDEFYLYQNKCQDKQPDSTSCDSNKICKSCNLNDCKYCDPNKIETCITCQKDFYKYEQKCQQQEPDNTFCDLDKVCIECTISNCKKCSIKDKNEQCDICSDNFYKFQNKCEKEQPENTYCNNKNECIECTISNCKKCSFKDKNEQCDICSDNFYKFQSKCEKEKPENTFCNIKNECKLCKTLECYDCTDHEQVNYQCLKCYEGQFFLEGQCYKKKPPNSICDLKNICKICKECECIQPGQYFNTDQHQCIDCKFKHCQICQSDGMSCQQCDLGFQKNKNSSSINQCSYCNNGIYADGNGICDKNLKCKSGCLSCTNSEDCQEYQEDYIFKNKDCHFTCSECTGQGQYDCLKCSSSTRIFKQFNKQCPCKPGYKENQIEHQSIQSQIQEQSTNNIDCIVDKDVVYESQTKQTRQNMINAVYFLYLTQLFMNVHPFGDSFLFSLQILGNVSFLSKDRQILEQFSIFNYFNILYVHQDKQTEQKYFEVVFITYKTIIETDIINNIGIMLVIYVIGVVLTLVAQVLRIFFNIYATTFQLTFLWNFQLKIIRISSNYLILNAAVHFMNVSKTTIFANISIITLLAIYIFNFIICFKKCQEKDTYFMKFMTENLDINKLFHRHYWIFIEIKKMTLIIFLVLFNFKFYYYAIIVISVFSFLLVAKQKPGLNILIDSIYLIINQLFLIAIASISIIAEQQIENNNTSQTETLRYIIDCIAFAFGLCQYLFCLEYQIRKWRQNRREKQETFAHKISQAPIFIQMPTSINYENITEILHQTTVRTMDQSSKHRLYNKNKFL